MRLQAAGSGLNGLEMVDIMAYQIGTTVEGMATVVSLGVVEPKSTFKGYSQGIELMDGMVRGAGYASATWRWGFLTRAQRDALRVFCGGKSARVFIETRTVDNEDVFDVFEAVMVWTDDEEREAGRRLDFVVEFRKLIPVS